MYSCGLQSERCLLKIGEKRQSQNSRKGPFRTSCLSGNWKPGIGSCFVAFCSFVSVEPNQRACFSCNLCLFCPFLKNAGFVCLKNSIILHEDKMVCNLKKKKKPQRRQQEHAEIVLLRHQQLVLIFVMHFIAMEQRWGKNSQRDLILNYFASFLSLSAKVYSGHRWQLSFTEKVAILSSSSSSPTSWSQCFKAPWLEYCWDLCYCSDTQTTIQF